MRQIRIACCGMVVSTRPFPDQIGDDDYAQLIAEIKADVRYLRATLPHRKVAIWVNEGSVAHLMGSVG